MTMNRKRKTGLVWLLLLLVINLQAQNVELISTDNSQQNFLNAYRWVLESSVNDYHGTSSFFDKDLFPAYGEHSVYWVMSGVNKGKFLNYTPKPTEYETVTSVLGTNYNLNAVEHLSVQFKGNAQSIAIFKSEMIFAEQSVSWQSNYFKYIIDSYLFKDASYFVDEQNILQNGFSGNTKMLIVPAFAEGETDPKTYIDSVFLKNPGIVQKIEQFLQNGGTIYTEGNAAYFAAKLGYLDTTNFNWKDVYSPAEGMAEISFKQNSEPFSFVAENTSLYASSIPKIDNLETSQILATLNTDNRAVYFKLDKSNGTILCNLGIPAAGGYPGVAEGSRQLQYTFNAILSAFLSPLDITRSVFNVIPNDIIASENAVAYDAVDTFSVIIQLRNLTGSTISNIQTTEIISSYFNFLDIATAGVNVDVHGDTLNFSGISVGAHSDVIIKYRLLTPSPTDSVHQIVDQFLIRSSFINVSSNKTYYQFENRNFALNKYRNYADVMFSARIVADADVNWKNFLGLDYQPFKVFMIMENKERTSAINTVYTQFVPKDVPFYWTDNSINIPILKTPGGKFVDVLRGSNSETNPDFDMDSDGNPDVWLDTASIYPKGYILTEDSVYWLNPWKHLIDSTATAVYEDIDHDGMVALDNDGDGIIDVHEPGDKIRVWKITWNVQTMPGYQYYDPYCSYEMWIDPPDLVPLSKGVGYAYGNLQKDENMFYPFAPDIELANLNDTSWSYWMERDEDGKVIWKNLILQSISNYEGFAFVDSSYQMKPTDSLLGLVPQPHREFIAVVSLGGEEIDMTHPTPQKSFYSKVDYETIFGEQRTTPIRTTYTYYAPLPNPLQFEYLSNGFTLTDPETKDTLMELPKFGMADIHFEISASTEYTYYWIRNVGYDVDYNDPSLSIEDVNELGDGVFGYFIYEIPKGFGDYKISLPKKESGEFDLASIVKIDGTNYQKWIDNPNTVNELEIWETPFTYQVYVPQILIPPALDDDNFDDVDDWIDDRGDRFQSETGYLHDAFMLGNGEDYPIGSEGVFQHEDFGYAIIDSGWSAGVDNTYGDDHFETLGKTRITILAQYEGKGKEGLVEIGKGGTLVCEEIFGGSPWVIHSHILNAYAQGVNIQLSSEISPQNIQYGKDTVYIKHVIEDLDEPRDFDDKFSPYNSSYGFGVSSATVMAGGKDPCSLISPDLETFSITDLDYDKAEITLLPLADGSNPDLSDFPKQVSGTFIEFKVEINNGSDLNWENVKMQADIPIELGASDVVLNYVAYPRPLVPGDDIGTFSAGWRFNQPEGEVLVKMGDSLNLLQPSRRAYFVFLLKLDPTLANGVYSIGFTCSGTEVNYKGISPAELNLEIPDAYFSVTNKDENGRPLDYQKTVIGQADLLQTNILGNQFVLPLNNAKWSLTNLNISDFDTLSNSLPASVVGNNETIDLVQFKAFPNLQYNKLFILEQVETNAQSLADTLATFSENLQYTYREKLYQVEDTALKVLPLGPMIEIVRKLESINGVPYTGEAISFQNSVILLGVNVAVRNYGNDLAKDVQVQIYNDSTYAIEADSLPENCEVENNHVRYSLGTMIPGGTKETTLYYRFTDIDDDDLTEVLKSFSSAFSGVLVNAPFYVIDSIPLNVSVYDFKLKNISLEDLGNELYSITATAVNRGIPATNVKFEIVPVIDGVNQNPIGESTIFVYQNRQIAQLSAQYSAENQTADITFKGVIDYDNAFVELFETNNEESIVIEVDTTSGIADLAQYRFSIYPNPVSTVLYFNYTLIQLPDKIRLRIINSSGQMIDEKIISDYKSGENQLEYLVPELSKGSYFYQFEAKFGERKQLFNGIFIK